MNLGYLVHYTGWPNKFWIETSNVKNVKATIKCTDPEAANTTL